MGSTTHTRLHPTTTCCCCLSPVMTLLLPLPLLATPLLQRTLRGGPFHTACAESCRHPRHSKATPQHPPPHTPKKTQHTSCPHHAQKDPAHPPNFAPEGPHAPTCFFSPAMTLRTSQAAAADGDEVSGASARRLNTTPCRCSNTRSAVISMPRRGHSSLIQPWSHIGQGYTCVCSHT